MSHQFAHRHWTHLPTLDEYLSLSWLFKWQSKCLSPRVIVSDPTTCPGTSVQASYSLCKNNRVLTCPLQLLSLTSNLYPLVFDDNRTTIKRFCLSTRSVPRVILNTSMRSPLSFLHFRENKHSRASLSPQLKPAKPGNIPENLLCTLPSHWAPG